MPYIRFKDEQYPLGATDLTVGAYDGATVRVPGDDPTARAVLRLGADLKGVIRLGGADAAVLVNGVPLGVEPSPLIHGDKIELGGHELAYGDDAKGGSTQFISAVNLAEALKPRGGAVRKPTIASGGRLVSLVDGREYQVSDDGVTFGREIGNDIVVASTEVSRRHAQIAPADNGYVLTDLSTNGVFVNGARIEKWVVLGRGDVIKIGPEEYRFYADAAKAEEKREAGSEKREAGSEKREAGGEAREAGSEQQKAVIDFELVDAMGSLMAPAQSSSAPPAAATPPAVAPPITAAPVAEPPVAAAPVAAPPVVVAPPVAAPVVAAPPVSPAPVVAPPTAVPPAAAAPIIAPPAAAPIPAKPVRTALAALEVVNEGPMKGQRFEIFTPLTNVGRGEHNDIALHDESVSDSHAKILKRGGSWWIVDQGSTNGTYVGGRRVQGEQELVGAPDVRFGSVKLQFRAVAVPGEAEGKGTRAIAAVHVDSSRKQSGAASPREAVAPGKGEPAVPAAKSKKGCAATIAFLVAAGAVGASTLLFLLTLLG